MNEVTIRHFLGGGRLHNGSGVEEGLQPVQEKLNHGNRNTIDYRKQDGATDGPLILVHLHSAKPDCL